MRDAIQSGFRVLIIAVMIAGPLMACAAMIVDSPESAHSCCPAPAKPDCTMTACIRATGESIEVVVAPGGEMREAASIVRIALAVHRELSASGPKHSFAPAGRYLAIHQFRI